MGSLRALRARSCARWRVRGRARRCPRRRGRRRGSAAGRCRPDPPRHGADGRGAPRRSRAALSPPAGRAPGCGESRAGELESWPRWWCGAMRCGPGAAAGAVFARRRGAERGRARRDSAAWRGAGENKCIKGRWKAARGGEAGGKGWALRGAPPPRWLGSERSAGMGRPVGDSGRRRRQPRRRAAAVGSGAAAGTRGRGGCAAALPSGAGGRCASRRWPERGEPKRSCLVCPQRHRPGALRVSLGWRWVGGCAGPAPGVRRGGGAGVQRAVIYGLPGRSRALGGRGSCVSSSPSIMDGNKY